VAEKLEQEKAARVFDEKYKTAVRAMSTATTEKDFYRASVMFEAISEYKDSADLKRKCEASAVEAKRKKELARMEEKYQAAGALLNSAKNERDIRRAAAAFEDLGGYKNSAELIGLCQRRLEFDANQKMYNVALDCAKSARLPDDYEQARNMFLGMGDFLDSADMAERCGRAAAHVKSKLTTLRVYNICLLLIWLVALVTSVVVLGFIGSVAGFEDSGFIGTAFLYGFMLLVMGGMLCGLPTIFALLAGLLVNKRRGAGLKRTAIIMGVIFLAFNFIVGMAGLSSGDVIMTVLYLNIFIISFIDVIFAFLLKPVSKIKVNHIFDKNK
jgi:hypothetical protein